MRLKKLLWGIAWIPFIVIKLVLSLLGLFIVPVSLWYFNSHNRWPKVFWLWYNDQEGCPDWWFKYADRKGGLIAKIPEFWWFAIRNPVNNFRYLFHDYPKEVLGWETNWDSEGVMEALQMLAAGQAMAYRWVWYGWKAGYRRVWLNSSGRYSEIWFGWKLGSDVPGLGFTWQIRLKRPIGN
jgi:hypothetical protein